MGWMSKLKRMKYRILVITGSRAEYSLLKSAINGIIQSRTLALLLLVTGMHTLRKYGSTINEIKKDKLPIACVVKIRERDDMLTALSKEIVGIKEYCMKQKPDLILVLGDRDEAFAGAIVGAHLAIPVGHIHGGDVSGYSVDEYIRHAITKFSHLHFTVTQKSYQRVIKLGEEKWRVFKVGAPGLDDLSRARYLSKKQLAEKLNLDINKKWLIILQHPTPLDKIDADEQISPTLKAVAEIPVEKLVIYPNNDTGSDVFISEIQKYGGREGFHIYKNFDRSVFLNLLKVSDVLIGNSSSGIIESGFFHLPVVNIGYRQLGRECGQNVIHVGYNQKQIVEAVLQALTIGFKRYCQKLPSPYRIGRTGEKIVKIIEKNINKPEIFYKKFTYV